MKCLQGVNYVEMGPLNIVEASPFHHASVALHSKHFSPSFFLVFFFSYFIIIKRNVGSHRSGISNVPSDRNVRRKQTVRREVKPGMTCSVVLHMRKTKHGRMGNIILNLKQKRRRFLLFFPPWVNNGAMFHYRFLR